MSCTRYLKTSAKLLRNNEKAELLIDMLEIERVGGMFSKLNMYLTYHSYFNSVIVMKEVFVKLLVIISPCFGSHFYKEKKIIDILCPIWL